MKRKHYIILIVITIVLIFISLKLKKPLIYGRIAIVLDDFGYNLNNLKILSEIKQPLTVSILPNLAYSKEIAKIAHQLGKEVILHLPLEPYPRESLKLERDTILTNMDKEKIKKILISAIQNTPSIRGVSNHMGSKATEDTRTMRVIFEELKKRKLFFLDNKVTPSSVCEALAKEMHLSFIKRDLFLDNHKDPYHIRGQILLLLNEAKRRGFAVGIGHDHHLILKILKEVLPKLEKKGFKFVFASELVK